MFKAIRPWLESSTLGQARRMYTCLRSPRTLITLSALGTSAFAGTRLAMSYSDYPTRPLRRLNWPVLTFIPPPPDQPWPYTVEDMVREDESDDGSFYASPRYVTHIDDHAISVLTEYYEEALPRTGRILDFCSSWISHYPQVIEDAARKGVLEVIGMGMNERELYKNAILHRRVLQDLNKLPYIRPDSVGGEELLDAATCVVSIDYLSKPREVLGSLRQRMHVGAKVHLVVSNRMFHTKVVHRWLHVSEEERLQMVANYLWYAGWRDIKVLVLSTAAQENAGASANFMNIFGIGAQDPLWVVTGTNPA